MSDAKPLQRAASIKATEQITKLLTEKPQVACAKRQNTHYDCEEYEGAPECALVDDKCVDKTRTTRLTVIGTGTDDRRDGDATGTANDLGSDGQPPQTVGKRTSAASSNAASSNAASSNEASPVVASPNEASPVVASPNAASLNAASPGQEDKEEEVEEGEGGEEEEEEEEEGEGEEDEEKPETMQPKEYSVKFEGTYDEANETFSGILQINNTSYQINPSPTPDGKQLTTSLPEDPEIQSIRAMFPNIAGVKFDIQKV
jgi:hypothetical protein